jgi:hypothetical protein
LKRSQGLKRTPMQRRTVGIKPRSEKRAKLMPQRNAFRERVLEERPQCEAGLEDCSGRSTDVHEALLRSAAGPIVPGEAADRLGQRFFALCRPCHSYITTHPAFALEQGYQLSKFGFSRRLHQFSANDLDQPLAPG